MQVYADPEFVRGLSRLHSEEREAVENCLYKLKNRNWDVGLRVKRLKGFPKRVWEARVNRADRLLFLIAPATHETSGATGSLYVLDYVDHDHVTRVRRRDLSASSYLSLVLEQAQQSENVEEEFDGCSSEQLEEWTHEEAQSGAATEYLRAYAQRFVATAEEIENLSDTERELWLTEEQMAVVTTAGHCVVSGTAGSGKTTMAVQRLLADTGSSQPKLYLAYNPWLVDYARELFQRLLPEEERESLKDVVHFKTVQQITREYLGPTENFPGEGEVRFADFQLPYQAWNKQIPAATAWSEIRSIIKGACLDPKRELLDLKEYRELGRSRSAYLHQDREVIHKLAQQYQKWLKEKKRYDEIDLSRQAIHQILSQRPAVYGTIVCDEVQDLTELQLEFIFLLNSKDGSLFFTGDLNQIINPSGFRWEEVNSHFYRRMQQKPEQKHLSYNFRSTGSIVKLADAILRLRGRLIGGNSEQQRDHHLQEGQKPRLISSSDEEAVKSLVAGLVGQYAVLVRTEAQRNRLKSETGSPFVFTIEEAKGLEFDRTLVWDFFRDQQSLWRKALGGTLSAKDGPALRHELNLLYVAATRPRHWLYFYDPHTTIWAEAELDGAFDYAVPDALAEEGEARLTLEQWSRQGKYYLDREFFEQASFCFEQAEDPTNARRVNAKRLEHKKQWVEAGAEYFALQDFSAAARLLEKGGAWRRASEAYQQMGASQEALRCDAQAAEDEKQWAVASRIWSSIGQMVKALDAIRKTNDPFFIKPLEAEALAIKGKHDHAAVLYEQVEDWDKAIQSWEKAEHWQDATAACIHALRYAEAEVFAERIANKTVCANLKIKIHMAQNNIDNARHIAETEMSSGAAIQFFSQMNMKKEVCYFQARLAEERGQLAIALSLWKQIGNEGEIKRTNMLLSQQVSSRANKPYSDEGSSRGKPLHDAEISRINLKDTIGWTALYQATVKSNYIAAKYLVEIGVDVNTQIRSGKTALMTAAFNDDVRIIEILLNAGANTEIMDNDGWAALMYAATENSIGAVRLLLDYGVDVEARNGNRGWTNGTTALMGAAYWGRTAVTKLLLESGADKEVLDRNGKTAMSLAKQEKHQAIVQLLQSHLPGGGSLATKPVGEDSYVTKYKAQNNVIKTKARILWDQGNMEVAEGQYVSAINYYWKAVNLDSSFTVPNLNLDFSVTDAHLNLGIALTKLGRWQEAINHYQHILHYEPGDILCCICMIKALVETDRLEETTVNQMREVEINPNDDTARDNLEDALAEAGFLRDALNKQIDLVFTNSEDCIALVNMGGYLADAGKPQEAVKYYEQAVSVNPLYALAKVELAKTYRVLRRHTGQ